MKRILLFLVTILAAFSLGVITLAIKTKQQQLSPEVREAEEYAVYADFINSFHPSNQGKVLIQNRTEPAYQYDGVGDETKYIRDHMPPTTSAETIEDFKSIARQTKELDRQLVLNQPYLLVTQEQRQHWFATREGKQEFRRTYPDSKRITLLSRVGFNKSFDEALVYWWGYCGGDCGGGGYYLLRKENGRWTIKQQKTWIS
jgi:hypothetical protein